jgi:hypothetical protein
MNGETVFQQIAGFINDFHSDFQGYMVGMIVIGSVIVFLLFVANSHLLKIQSALETITKNMAQMNSGDLQESRLRIEKNEVSPPSAHRYK